MGEVYKATDSRLNRTVAIKVMPPHFADDPDMKQRFEREAQTIAGLSHPHICTLHDVGEAPGPDPNAPAVRFLVMEYLEGETLADRVARSRALGLDEALRIAIAIADALDKAHRQGIVHRDLKPANVMLSKNGVKLLDFGLAKWTASGQDVLGAMPTRADVTSPGMILGTLQYMAPEQVEGKDADARSDIFAFGALLYEMVTGRKAFQGKSQAILISAIMTGEPQPLSVVQPAARGVLDHVVTRCLAKDPEDRWQDAHSLLVQLQWIARGRTDAEMPAAASAARRTQERTVRLALICAGVLIAALAAPAFLYLRGPAAAEAFPFRMPVVGLERPNFAISPNGRDVALVARPDVQEPSLLYTRALAAPTFRAFADTDGAAQPFWSPDSRSIAFVADGRLKRVDTSGGAPKDLAPAQDFSGGTWNAAGIIVFGTSKGLFRVSAEGGGTPEPITTVEAPETGHFWPWFLPDGTHYLYLAWSNEAAKRIVYTGALGSKDRTQLMAAESNVAYASGHVLFHRDATLLAQPFDATTLKTTGDAVQVAGGIAHSPASGRGAFDVSEAGALVFYQGTSGPSGRGLTGRMQFGWWTRNRTRQALALPTDDSGDNGDMDLSPDQKLIALTKLAPGSTGSDIWIVDWAKGIPRRLTFDPADDLNPVWSHDNTRIAFTSYRNGNADIYVKNANGVGEETPLVQTPADEFVEAWSRDGRYLAYVVRGAQHDAIHALPLFGDGKSFPVVEGPYRKDEPQFSHDGKWLAYTSDELGPGKFEVYVIKFPERDQKIKVSNAGGGQPRWRQNGKELFYRTPGAYMSVAITPGPKIASDIPVVMFPPPTLGPGNVSAGDPVRHQWAAAPDGQSFLVREPPNFADGGRGSTPWARNTHLPPGVSAGTVTPGRPGGAARGLNSPALTVILQWPASIAKSR